MISSANPCPKVAAIALNTHVSPLRLASPQGNDVNQQKMIVAAGMAIAVTSLASAHVWSNRLPVHEGQVRVIADVPLAPIADRALDSTSAQIIPPETIWSSAITPELMQTVLDRLRHQDISLDWSDLQARLKVIPHAEASMLEIRYRDTNPERLNQVLQTIAQTLTTAHQDCSTTCRDRQFITALIPQIQTRMQTLQKNLDQLQHQYDLDYVEEQYQQMTAYAAQIERQEDKLRPVLASARDRYQQFQQQMPSTWSSNTAITILHQDGRYQMLLLQLRDLEGAIVGEFTQPQLRLAALRTFEDQYQSILLQMHSQAREVGTRYAMRVLPELLQARAGQAVSAEFLQRWLSTAHHLAVLELRHQTIATVKTALNQRIQQQATLLQQRQVMQQQLAMATATLHQYQAKQEELVALSPAQPLRWQVVSPPEILQEATGQLASLDVDWQRAMGTGLLLGTLTTLGIGIPLIDR